MFELSPARYMFPYGDLRQLNLTYIDYGLSVLQGSTDLDMDILDSQS